MSPHSLMFIYISSNVSLRTSGIYDEIPMTPQAGRAPALPVFLDSGWSLLPRSSVPAWTTMVRYKLHISTYSEHSRGENLRR